MTQSSKKVQKMPQYTEFFYTNYAKLSKNHCNTREKLLLSLFYRNFAHAIKTRPQAKVKQATEYSPFNKGKETSYPKIRNCMISLLN